MYGFGCAPTNVNKRKRFTAGQQLYVKGTKAKDEKELGGWWFSEREEDLDQVLWDNKTARGGSMHGEAVATPNIVGG
jgi:hypothetical protein